MTEETKPQLILDDKSYDLDSLTTQEKHLVGQIQDLSSQITTMRAKLQQIEVAKEAFTSMLKSSLEAPVEVEENE